MMKRLKGIALALVFMLAVTSVAMADVEVVNLSPELVQEVICYERGIRNRP